VFTQLDELRILPDIVRMQLTREQFEQIAHLLPRQRGNVHLDSFNVLNAILYVASNGCKWRALPRHYGFWHSVYMRMSRWAKAGVLDAVFESFQRQRLIHLRLEALSLDSTTIQVHPDGTGAPQKTAPNPSDVAVEAGAPNFIWLPRLPATL